MVDFSSAVSKINLFGQINPNDVLTAEDERRLKERKAKEELKKRKDQQQKMEDMERQKAMMEEAQAFESRRHNSNNYHYSKGPSNSYVGRGRARRHIHQDSSELPLWLRQRRVQVGISQLVNRDEESIYNNNFQRKIWHGDRDRQFQSIADQREESCSSSNSSKDVYEDAVSVSSGTSLHSSPLHSSPLHSSPLHSSPLHSSPLHSSPLHSSPSSDPHPEEQESFPPLPYVVKRRSRIAAKFTNPIEDFETNDQPVSYSKAVPKLFRPPQDEGGFAIKKDEFPPLG